MKTQVANQTLADVLDQHTVPGSLWHREAERIRCVACGHRCLIGDGKRGICKVRYNENGQLKVPFGYVAGLQCDPVEKKPFFHVYPGSDALTFGMMGCDLHCSYCQNWVTSQALRDAAASAPIRAVSPAQLVELARREQARLVVSSYNEPLITAEWAVAVFEAAKAAGLDCAFVSNGNATPEVLDFLAPWIIAYKVDLKSFDDRHYRSLGGELGNITDTIRMIHARGIWLEIVTLVIPGFNDGEGELRTMAGFLASVSRDIPWHVTAFHKDYRMTDPDATSPATLMRACEIGAEAGLRFVYAGNLPGQVGPWENTRCPNCQETVIERTGYLIRVYRLTANGCCPRCQFALPGIWPDDIGAVRTGNDRAAYVRRLPRAVAPVSPAVRSVQSLPMVSDNATGEPTSRAFSEGSQPMTTAVPTTQRPELSPEQKEHLIGAVSDLVRQCAAGQQAALDDPSLAGLDKYLIAGAFVSLKRGKHLRACCGVLGEPTPLLAVLQEAVARTVWEDIRFPPVSPTEVEHLDLEVWLLGERTPVQARGAERADAITIGKHGIQVARGQQQALFLPGVALDNRWDSQRFLNQVCVKAGLPASAWRDDTTALFTFEGTLLRRQRAADGVANHERPPLPEGAFRQEHLQAYAEFCRQNIVALLYGAMPTYYFAGAPDGNVTGVILTLQPALQASGQCEAMHFCQISLRRGVPLQNTLFTLGQNAAQALAGPGLTAEALEAVRVSVAILHDPMLHGTVLEPDLLGVDPPRRALMVIERNKIGVVFDPARPPAELLAEASRLVQVSQPASAAVFSMAALALAPVSVSIAPRPVHGPAIRPPGAAGTFYPADAGQLARLVDDLVSGERNPESWAAAMVPHAGLAYSGRIAAGVLKRLRVPRTIIILGPKHTALGVEWAVAPHQTWTFPGGSLEADPVLAQQLCEAIPGLEMDAGAHQREHAIEVELPLLARLAPETRVVGIAIGAGDLDSCRRFARGLASVMEKREDRPLLLISSDMNHYATDAENRRLDELALSALERLDPAVLYETVMENDISMCGILPAVIAMETLRLLGGLKKAERTGYATSADVNGDASRVVGYAGMLFA